MSSIRELIRLQEVDSELAVRRTGLEQIERQLADTAALEEVRERLTHEWATQAEIAAEGRVAEMDVEETREQLVGEERKLYGGSVRNPKDLVSLQQEVDSLQARQKQREEAQLQVMQRIEAQNGVVAELSQELSRLEAERAELEAGLAVERERLTGEVDALAEQRRRIAALVPSRDLALYDSLLVSKQGRAVSRVERSICQGCRINLPLSIQQRVRADRMLVQCPSCGRVLCLG